MRYRFYCGVLNRANRQCIISFCSLVSGQSFSLYHQPSAKRFQTSTQRTSSQSSHAGESKSPKDTDGKGQRRKFKNAYLTSPEHQLSPAQRPLRLIEYQGIFMMLKREVNTEFNKTMLSDTSQMIETEAQL